MTRQRMFLEMSCVDAARERMKHVYDTFDTVAVQFSGGKDSTAVLYLAKEIHDERGLGPVKVIFRDEEMVSPATVRFLEEVRSYDWVDMEWYCLPVATEVWVLGRREYCLLWSKKREDEGRLVRPMPEWAITAEHFGLSRDKSVPEAVDYYTMQGKKGRTAFIMGVRANESMLRYRSCVQKLHENYITAPYKLNRNIPLRFVKPIYDWTTDDVLKFVVEEHGGTYCEYYDLAAVAGGNTRVGVPLHAVAARRLTDVVKTEPDFYDRLVECFPHIDAQRRLWGDFDIENLILSYSRGGWDGVRRCIDENMITPGLKKRAMAYSAQFRKKNSQDPKAYPLHSLVRTLLLNDFHSTAINPVGPKTKAYRLSEANEQ